MRQKGGLANIIRVGRRLGRADILFWVLPYLMVLVTVGTVTQKWIGLYEAQKTYFSSLFFMVGPLPFPGGYTVLAIMAVNLLCKFVFLSQWKASKVGIHIIHLSVIILLVGGLLTAMTQREGFMPLREGQTRDAIMAYAEMEDNLGGLSKDLPFSITLNNFRRAVYPGTNMPKEYESRITIRDGDITWPAVISMNEPVRYGGFTLYQSSTLVNAEGEPVSILSIVTNKGWVFPYISGILLAFGLIYHLVWRLVHR